MGIIYIIICNETGERYVGSTKTTISKRMKTHRKQNDTCSCHQIILRNNYRIEVLEEVDNNDILRIREQEWIDKTECVNKVNAYVSNEDLKQKLQKYNKEYELINKEKRKEQKRIYYLENKDQIDKKNKEFYEKNREAIAIQRKTKQKVKHINNISIGAVNT